MSVYRKLLNETEWNIDYNVKLKMNSTYLWQIARTEDIKWIEWRNWMESKLIHYLLENGKLMHNVLECLVFGYIRNAENQNKNTTNRELMAYLGILILKT